MNETLDLNLISYFVAVADSGSFSKAAAQLGVPRPTVSRAIARLEKDIGARLLQRTTRQVALSTTGAAFYDRVAPRFTALRDALTDVPELEEEPSGRLRVTAAVDVGAAVLAELFARFMARYPAIELDVHLTNQTLDLVKEGFDVGLRVSTRPLKDSTLSAKSLGSFLLSLYASPQYLARRGIPKTPKEAALHEWVRFRGLDVLELQGPKGRASFAPSGRLTCDEMFFAVEAVRSHTGLGLLPTFLVDAAVTAGELVPVLPQWSSVGGQFWFVSPSTKQLPRKVVALREFLHEALRLRPLAPSP